MSQGSGCRRTFCARVACLLCAACLAAGGATTQEPARQGGGAAAAQQPAPRPTPEAPTPPVNKEQAINTALQLVKSIQEARAETLPLSLNDCIRIGLENNFDIQIEGINPLVSAESVVAARAAFDPSIASGTDSGDSLLSLSEERSHSTTSASDSSYTNSVGAGLGIKHPLYTGGTMRYGYDLSRSYSGSSSGDSSSSLSWTSEVFLAASHPLLKGAGLDYNLGDIRIALNNKDISEEAFRSEALSVVFRIEEAYWNLVRAIEDLRVSLKSLQVAIDNRQSSKLQVEAGTRPELDLTTADAGMAERLSSVIKSEASVRDREDQLKNLINLPRSWYLTDLRITPLDQPHPATTGSDEPFNLAQFIETALRCRPEINEAELGIRNADISLRLRKNELLPSLNVSGVIGYDGNSDSYHGAAEDMPEFRSFRRSLSLTLEYPIGNRSANAACRQAKLARRSAELDLQRTRQNVVVSIRAALRQIRTNRGAALATQTARDLHRQRLEAEQRKKEVGLATSLNVLDVEADLVRSERDHLNALIDYQISLANLDKEAGTLLDVRGIDIKPLMDRNLPAPDQPGDKQPPAEAR